MTKWIFMLVSILMFHTATSQEKSLVTFEVAEHGSVRAGDTINVQITLNILPGWMIYAPTPGNKLQDVQVMNLRFHSVPSGLRKLGEMNMPEPRLNKSYQVYMDQGNVFYQRFIVNENTAEGIYNIAAQLKYQACSSSICYPPVTEKIDVAIKVEKSLLPAQEIIKNATQRAKKENKKAFIMFHSSWCVWCRKMDTAMQNDACKNAFDNNYIIDHLTVFESDDHKNNYGANELLKKHQSPHSGIPFWLIFDGDGKLIADSQIRPPGTSLEAPGKNMGCPTAPKEIDTFLGVLKRTSAMTKEELAAIATVFANIK